MSKLEECVRSVQMDGLLWGASKLVPVGYGIKKLQINCVVEDEKVGTDLLEEEITKFEDFVSNSHWGGGGARPFTVMTRWRVTRARDLSGCVSTGRYVHAR